jgi:hypothetical protein
MDWELVKDDYIFATRRLVICNGSDDPNSKMTQHEIAVPFRDSYDRNYRNNTVKYSLRWSYSSDMCYQYIYKITYDVESRVGTTLDSVQSQKYNTYICDIRMPNFCDTCYDLRIIFPYEVKNVKMYVKIYMHSAALHFTRESPTIYKITDFTIDKQFIKCSCIYEKSIVVEYEYDGDILPLKLIGNIVYWNTEYRRKFLYDGDCYMYADVMKKQPRVHYKDIASISESEIYEIDKKLLE